MGKRSERKDGAQENVAGGRNKDSGGHVNGGQHAAKSPQSDIAKMLAKRPRPWPLAPGEPHGEGGPPGRFRTEP